MLTLALGLSTLAVTLYAAYEIRASRRALSEFRLKYLDALASITARAARAEELAASQARTIEGFRDSIGDRRRADALSESVTYLQERLTEAQRSVVALTDLKTAQVVVKQGKEQEPEAPVAPRPSRWALAAGLPQPVYPQRSDTLKAPNNGD